MIRTHTEEMTLAFWCSPIGWIGVAAGPGGIRDLLFREDLDAVRGALTARHPRACEGEWAGGAMVQVREYFHRARETFSLLLDLRGLSPFTAQVLNTLLRVPFGQTISYGELALLAGHSGAARGVGRAMAINPLPLVIPCHRVLGATGRLTGYSGGEGVATKAWLLHFEGGEGKNIHPFLKSA